MHPERSHAAGLPPWARGAVVRCTTIEEGHMATMQDNSPTDAVVCATIAQDGNRFGMHCAFTENVAFLYGGSRRRACAHLRRLRKAGLVESMPHRAGCLVWSLTPPGTELAAGARPACRKCLAPTGPDTRLCWSCEIALLEDKADREDDSAAFSLERAQKHAARARSLRARAAEMRAELIERSIADTAEMLVLEAIPTATEGEIALRKAQLANGEV